MVNFTFDSDCGDLGRASGLTPIQDIPIVVIRIAEVYSKLRFKVEEQLCYCVEFRSEYRNTVLSMLKDIETEGLPGGVKFFSLSGNKVFEIRGVSGGVVSSCCFYLISEKVGS
jgi:hypothetical protein